MKEISSQLNKLKDIKPDSEWKEKNREILLSQISGSISQEEIQTGRFSFFYNLIHQPVLMVMVILATVLGGGTLSIHASQNSKPGDSLYIAKLISEKAQLAITFDDKSKAKLGLEFAGNRTKEIAQILAEENNEEDKAAKVEKLSDNFRKEIYAVRNRLKNTDNQEEQNDDQEVFSANLGKSNQRIEISDPYDGQGDYVKGVESNIEDINIEAQEETATSTQSAELEKNIDDTLDEVEKMFDEQNYDGTLNKLEEAGDIIGEVLGEKLESDSATSTEG